MREARASNDKRELGNPEFGCELAPTDFVAYARACGADGFRARTPEDLRPAISEALRSPRAGSSKPSSMPMSRPPSPTRSGVADKHLRQIAE